MARSQFTWKRAIPYRDACGYTYRLDLFTDEERGTLQVWRDGKPLTGTVHTDLDAALAEVEYYTQHQNDRYHDRLRAAARK